MIANQILGVVLLIVSSASLGALLMILVLDKHVKAIQKCTEEAMKGWKSTLDRNLTFAKDVEKIIEERNNLLKVLSVYEKAVEAHKIDIAKFDADNKGPQVSPIQF